MINLPAIKVEIRKSYLTQQESNKWVSAYLLAVDARKFDRLRFTVFLESGAIWSGLPIEAIACDRYGADLTNFEHIDNERLQPYTNLEGPVTVCSYELMKNANLIIKDFGPANYLFTINYEGLGIAEDPEQYKTHNICVLETGHLCAVPNNYIRVIEPWFTDVEKSVDNYRRDKKFYFAGG